MTTVWMASQVTTPPDRSTASESAPMTSASRTPPFAIRLAHQLRALPLGGTTEKMKFGHHGANHPVKDLTTGKVEITSQNHGFAVRPDSLPAEVEQTHLSLFDGSLDGWSVELYR